eukprot:565618-Prorocentrum_minimum.AAC.2
MATWVMGARLAIAPRHLATTRLSPWRTRSASTATRVWYRRPGPATAAAAATCGSSTSVQQ